MQGTRIFLAVFAMILVASGAGAFLILGNLSADVPPPVSPPTSSVDHIEVDGLRLNASAYYWQDFMPDIPDEGPPFMFIIWITVKNNGNSTVDDLTAIKATLFYSGTLTPLRTFMLTRVDSGANSTAPGGTILMEFTNQRGEVFSPDIEEGTEFYARVLFTWVGNYQAILTTPPSPLMFTY